MATFLTLCGDLTDESGAIGTAPSAVTAQTGRQKKCVNWIRRAWEAIQNVSPDWRWMQGEVSAVALTINDMNYSSSDLGISSRFGEWKGDRAAPGFTYRPWTIYDNSIGQADESPLTEITYELWRTKYDRGTHDAQRPTEYAIAPDRTFRLGPKPDIAYRVRGEYRKSIQVLAADADEPEMPSRFHDLIVWRAMMLMANHDESDPIYIRAMREYGPLMLDLQRDQLPAIDAHAFGPIA